MKEIKRVLVIRIGALGDIILCFQAFHEIRMAHPAAEIAFLTMPPFADFARSMPWFNRVLVDPRPSGWEPQEWLKLLFQIRAFKPDRVYDLQGKNRQAVLYGLLGGPLGPEWSGRAPFCSHPRLDPPPSNMHFTEFLAAQLQLADVPSQGPADLGWLEAPLDGFQLPERFAILVPGCAPHREYKRWPARSYAKLADKLHEKGIASIAVGTRQDANAIAAVKAAASVSVEDFSGKTTLLQLGALIRRAVCVVANDTGPMHMAAALGAPTLGLMSEQVNATWNAPHGPHVTWLQGKPLAGLGADEVFLALSKLLDTNKA